MFPFKMQENHINVTIEWQSSSYTLIRILMNVGVLNKSKGVTIRHGRVAKNIGIVSNDALSVS